MYHLSEYTVVQRTVLKCFDKVGMYVLRELNTVIHNM